jgi:hypothetical protein
MSESIASEAVMPVVNALKGVKTEFTQAAGL